MVLREERQLVFNSATALASSKQCPGITCLQNSSRTVLTTAVLLCSSRLVALVV